MTDINISIEGLSAELLSAYLRSGMQRGKAGDRAIKWAFTSNPKAFAVARMEETIVGVSCYIHSRMKFGGTLGSGLQAVDSFVFGDMRGKGIFTKLACAYDSYAEQSEADLVWGFPNDNAAPAWFGKLGWQNHGQVPFLVKPLRSGFLLRKLRMGLDFSISRARDQGIQPVKEVGEWGNVLWTRVSPRIVCGTVRDRSYLTHRLFQAPHASEYRVVADPDLDDPAMVATRQVEKHGARIAYLMEALGGRSLSSLLNSELGYLRDAGAELVLAWAYPWSPNYSALRRAGFFPLPERLRPIRIWFGSTPKTTAAACSNNVKQWYLSYLDSDTV